MSRFAIRRRLCPDGSGAESGLLVSSAIMFVGIVVVMLVVEPSALLVSVLTLGSTFLVFKGLRRTQPPVLRTARMP